MSQLTRLSYSGRNARSVCTRQYRSSRRGSAPHFTAYTAKSVIRERPLGDPRRRSGQVMDEFPSPGPPGDCGFSPGTFSGEDRSGGRFSPRWCRLRRDIEYSIKECCPPKDHRRPVINAQCFCAPGIEERRLLKGRTRDQIMDRNRLGLPGRRFSWIYCRAGKFGCRGVDVACVDVGSLAVGERIGRAVDSRGRELMRIAVTSSTVA